MASPSDLVPMRFGLAVPVGIIAWLIDAEHRGMHFRILPDDRLHVGPREAVDAADMQFIQQHKDTLKHAVCYVNSIAELPL